jgi:5-hydroxyisourate hydrolase
MFKVYALEINRTVNNGLTLRELNIKAEFELDFTEYTTNMVENNTIKFVQDAFVTSSFNLAIELSNFILKQDERITTASLNIKESVWKKSIADLHFEKERFTFEYKVKNDRANLKIESSLTNIEFVQVNNNNKLEKLRADLTWTFDPFYDFKSLNHTKIAYRINDLFLQGYNPDSIKNKSLNNFLLKEINEINYIEINVTGLTTNESLSSNSSKTEYAIRVLNAAEKEQTENVIKDIIYSDKIVETLIEKRPYLTLDQFRQDLNELYTTQLNKREYLTIIQKFTRLGDSIDNNKHRFIREECSEMDLYLCDEIKKLNQIYEEKFKHTFILSVSGLNINQILKILRKRLNNDLQTEFESCVNEVRKIINVRVSTGLNSFALSVKNELSVNQPKGHISSHILNLTTGKPASCINSELLKLDESTNKWLVIGKDVSNSDGRMLNLLNENDLSEGQFKIVFYTEEYFKQLNLDTFYSNIEIGFLVKDATQKYHIPLLLNQFGYSTYRGS